MDFRYCWRPYCQDVQSADLVPSIELAMGSGVQTFSFILRSTIQVQNCHTFSNFQNVQVKTPEISVTFQIYWNNNIFSTIGWCGLLLRVSLAINTQTDRQRFFFHYLQDAFTPLQSRVHQKSQMAFENFAWMTGGGGKHWDIEAEYSESDSSSAVMYIHVWCKIVTAFADMI